MKKRFLVTGAAVPDAATLDHREIDEAGGDIFDGRSDHWVAFITPSFDTLFIPFAQLKKTNENYKTSIEDQIDLSKLDYAKIYIL